MDFYYGDHLRWVFGFENPNKAAALIASLLPLIWLLAGCSWRLKGRWGRRILLFVASVVLLAGWYCLFKTYSRGGIVAALAAFSYIGWMNRRDWRRRWFHASLMAICIAALFFSTKVSDRSVGWVVHRDQSVDNRFTLWSGGLQMLSSFPDGVGRGNSGNFYMQWFQPLNATEGYRTLVNSYLTFATEQGIWIFGLTLFLAILLWLLSRLKAEAATDSLTATFVTGFRASLIALCVAAFFSTTLETFLVWIPGIIAMIGLIAISGIRWRNRNVFAMLNASSLIAIAVCAALWLSGYFLRGDVVISGTPQFVSASPRHSKSKSKLIVWPDQKVLGMHYGKLLRKLAIKNSEPIEVAEVARGQRQDDKIGKDSLLVMGDQVAFIPQMTQKSHGNLKRLILLAPAMIDKSSALRILHSAKRIEILLPAIDEDGRVAFWQNIAEKAGLKAEVQSLPGVGTEVDWAWDQVIASAKNKP